MNFFYLFPCQSMYTSLLYIYSTICISVRRGTPASAPPRTPVAAPLPAAAPLRADGAGQGLVWGRACLPCLAPVLNASRRKETQIIYSDLYSTLGKKRRCALPHTANQNDATLSLRIT